MFDVCVSPRERGAGQSTGQEGKHPRLEKSRSKLLEKSRSKVLEKSSKGKFSAITDCLFRLVHLQSNFYAFCVPRRNHESFLTGRTMIQEVTVVLGAIYKSSPPLPDRLSQTSLNHCHSQSVRDPVQIFHYHPAPQFVQLSQARLGQGFTIMFITPFYEVSVGRGLRRWEGVGQKTALPCS